MKLQFFEKTKYRNNIIYSGIKTRTTKPIYVQLVLVSIYLEHKRCSIVYKMLNRSLLTYLLTHKDQLTSSPETLSFSMIPVQQWLLHTDPPYLPILSCPTLPSPQKKNSLCCLLSLKLSKSLFSHFDSYFLTYSFSNNFDPLLIH